MDPQTPDNQPANTQSSSSPTPGPTTTNSEVNLSPPPPPVSPTAAPLPPTPPKPKAANKKKLTLVGIIVAVVLLLLGASAAAYFGIVVPNKPENKLAAAFTNLASHDQMTLSGRLDVQMKEADTEFKGVAIDYDAKVDLEKSLLGLAGNVGVSGTQFPYEMRYIDQDLYFKVGGLDGIGDLLSGVPSEEAAFYSQLLSNINDQWYVVDRSFWQQAGASAACVADLSFALTNEDVEKIEAAYKKYPLFSIKSTSSADVDGTPTTKYELEPASDEIADNFNKELESLSVVKKVKDCAEETGVSKDVSEAENNAKEAEGTIYAYVTGDKQLKKIEINTDDDEMAVKMTINFDFKAVTVEKPEGAKPIQDILNDLYADLLPGATQLQGGSLDGSVLE